MMKTRVSKDEFLGEIIGIGNPRKTEGKVFSHFNLEGKEDHPVNVRARQFVGCDFSGMTFQNVDLSYTHFLECNLQDVNFKDCEMHCVKFEDSGIYHNAFFGCDLSNTEFIYTELEHINFNICDMSVSRIQNGHIDTCEFYKVKVDQVKMKTTIANTTFPRTEIGEINFSESRMESGRTILEKSFEFNDEGMIVYKAFDAFFSAPKHWIVEPGKYVTEVPNPDVTTNCGCGVNFGTLDWINNNLNGDREVYKCLIEWKDLADVIIPIGTSGKFRCARLKILEHMGIVRYINQLSEYHHEKQTIPTSD